MGRSVHNQRIERLWVDVWKDVANVYYSLFTSMETGTENGGYGILDPGNDLHLWVLHYVFLPRLNRDLALFAAQKNNQGLSTERGRSPNRIFLTGMLSRFQSTTTAAADFWSGRTINLDMAEHFQRGPRVEPDHCPLSAERFRELRQAIDPVGPNTNLQAVQLFQRVLDYLLV